MFIGKLPSLLLLSFSLTALPSCALNIPISHRRTSPLDSACPDCNKHLHTPQIPAANLTLPTINRNVTALWHPAQMSRFQIVLSNTIQLKSTAPVNPDVEIFDLDLFTTPASTISTLHSQGKRVICYFSAGTYEPYRPDSQLIARRDRGSRLPDWPDERWVRLYSPDVRSVMLSRLDLAKSKGCDAVDPDNMDGFTYSNDVGVTKKNTIEFVQFLSREAAKRGMSMGLKNALDIIPDVLDYVSFAVNEQCAQYAECDRYAPFITARKPVFHIEYPESAPRVSSYDVARCCDDRYGRTRMMYFSTILKNMELDGWAHFCDGSGGVTPVAPGSRNTETPGGGSSRGGNKGSENTVTTPNGSSSAGAQDEDSGESGDENMPADATTGNKSFRELGNRRRGAGFSQAIMNSDNGNNTSGSDSEDESEGSSMETRSTSAVDSDSEENNDSGSDQAGSALKKRNLVSVSRVPEVPARKLYGLRRRLRAIEESA